VHIRRTKWRWVGEGEQKKTNDEKRPYRFLDTAKRLDGRLGLPCHSLWEGGKKRSRERKEKRLRERKRKNAENVKGSHPL